MAKIAYILLCHKAPGAVIAQAERLTAAGDCVAIHFDGRAPESAYRRIRLALADNPGVAFPRRRVRCGWGEWSLVRATLNTLAAAEAAFPEASHFYLISGDCMPIKSADYAHALLDADDADHIEAHDFFASGWIKTGFKEERLIYRHFVNERTRRRLFYASYGLQKRLGLRRALPSGLRIMIGSQWWCLRRQTVEAILRFCRDRPDVLRFFRTTWIPDETVFQTLVRHLVPAGQIRNRTLTFLKFSDYGIPVTFYNDHYDLLLAQDYLFARKISPQAAVLQRRLGALYTAKGGDFPISNEGHGLYDFLTGRGRVGRRYAPRFWERGTRLGRGRELSILCCKKWHVAKRLLPHIQRLTGIPAVQYLFDEVGAALPDLGGIGSTLDKRSGHRRALVRLLFDHFGTDRLMICLDPANLDILRDFYGDGARIKLLDIRCAFGDDYLIGHARRVGLAAERTAPDLIARLLPTLRSDIAFEAEQIAEAGFADHYVMRETDAPETNAAVLAQFLSIPYERAREIAVADDLFAD